MPSSTISPIHPGETLLEEFLQPLGLSQYRLGERLEVEVQVLKRASFSSLSIRRPRRTPSIPGRNAAAMGSATHDV